MINKYYDGTITIINLSTEIGKLLGIIEAANLRKPKTQLRRENRIKTIHSSLQIEGNTLTIEQVSDLIENNRVFGPAKDIKEVQNAIKVYEKIDCFDAFNEVSYRNAHELLMTGLIERAGQYRTKSVGIFKGEMVAHLAPPAWNVSHLMTNLFDYLKYGKDHLLIKSCVFHYEMEFIHPFMDGNGRMGRLWQTIILMRENPVFEYLPIEVEIKTKQQAYYEVLAQCDKEGVSTKFIEFMLLIIQETLEKLIAEQRKIMTESDRILYFWEYYKEQEFTRKEYRSVFLNISSATASRDLKKGVELGRFKKFGQLRTTKYELVKKSTQ